MATATKRWSTPSSVKRPATDEATALGAAYLAGLGVGVWAGVEELRKLGKPGRTFTPRWPEATRERRIATWHKAVRALIGYYRSP